MKLATAVNRTPMRYAKELAIACSLAAAVAIVVGLWVGASGDTPQEWPWYLAIVGTGFPLLIALCLPRPLSTGTLLVVLGVLILWIYTAGVCIDLADLDHSLGRAPIAVAVFGVGLTAFFGVLFLQGDQRATGLSDAALRHAIGAAFLLGFLALLSIGVFHEAWPQSPLGEKLVDQLTTLLGVVVAFYFGSGTIEWLKYRERQQTIRQGLDPGDTEPDPPPG